MGNIVDLVSIADYNFKSNLAGDFSSAGRYCRKLKGKFIVQENSFDLSLDILVIPERNGEWECTLQNNMYKSLHDLSRYLEREDFVMMVVDQNPRFIFIFIFINA
ncbi:uncharacterized protein LOC129316074 [Prosopis cineraria]|uniref:uncharacterized protein LOC129316074 n=1 Tax=Prosopis cineraria TaxID=364024 RepID=UPI002410608D|nr:uncharacterized protein LOC129316074 [Prosopis cineraria]